MLSVGVPEGNTASDDVGNRSVRQIPQLRKPHARPDADGRALPRLAERWRWEDNDLTLRIYLRPSIFLHDGRPFAGQTAADLVREAVTERVNLAPYPSFADIDTVMAAGDLELAIRPEAPSAMLPEDLTVPARVSQGRTGRPCGHWCPTVQSLDKSEVVLERFDRYYLGKPAIDRVVVRPFDSLRASWASLLRGELDMVYDVPADAVEFIRNDDVRGGISPSLVSAPPRLQLQATAC